MNRTFLVDIDTGSDTDFVGVAEDLKDILDAHAPFHVLSVKPWAGKTLGALPTLIPPSSQTLPPSGQQS